MAKKEVKTDLWVASQLDKCKIQFTAQGSDVTKLCQQLPSVELEMLVIPNMWQL